MTVKSYEDLEAWQQAMLLVEKVYRMIEGFPAKKAYHLADQLCRAAVSIPSNIAEGSMRHTTRDYIRFVAISQGSLAEVETQVMIARRLAYITEDSFKDVLETARRTGRLLNGLFQALERKLDGSLSSPATSTSHQHLLNA
jgi:four helix bundle protein